MKFAHLSDIHFTTFFRNTALYRFEKLLQFCNNKDVDHLIITGDLVENPDPYDFELLRKILKKTGFLSSDRLSVVIGNHDIFGGVVTVQDLFNFKKNCEAINYNLKIKEFHNFFSEAFESCIYISPLNIFPYAKVIEDILIVGLNSVAEYSKSKNVFASNGEINSAQLNELIEIFNFYKSCRIKLVLIHHHFQKTKLLQENQFGNIWQLIEKQTTKLRTKRKLFEIFNNFNVNLVLHGHYHESLEYYRKGIRFLNAGGSFKNKLISHGQINLINTDDNRLKIEIHKIPLLLNQQVLSLNFERQRTNGFIQ
jgi:predicted phosphodiesterase